MILFFKKLPMNRNIFKMVPIHKNENEKYLNQKVAVGISKILAVGKFLKLAVFQLAKNQLII
jgi:hypothetical protein